jgi:hypothetical protein
MKSPQAVQKPRDAGSRTQARFCNTLIRLENDFMIHEVHPLQFRLDRFLLAEDIHQQ